MEVFYLLKCYDVLIRQLNSSNPVNYKDGLDYFLRDESESFRIYKVKINNQNGMDDIHVDKPIHSYHPAVQKLELKSQFNFNEFENHIPLLKSLIKFNGHTILFASDPSVDNTFYVYEKCGITELNSREIFFLYCNKFLYQENQNIKLAINDKVFKLKTEVKIEHYIHKNQLAIESQLNKLIKLINPENSNDLYEYSTEYNKKDCYKTIYVNLEKLLVFIDREYNDYLNGNIKVPHRKVLMSEYTIKPKLDYVRDSLMSFDLNQELLKIAFEPIILLSTISIQNQITYYQFNYALKYISILTEHLNEAINTVDDSTLCNWLIELNMNSFRLFDYKTNLIQTTLHNIDSENERLELLFIKLKKFNQHRFLIKKAFHEKLPKIKVQICNWLEEEIDFINRKRNLTDIQKVESFTEESKFKIELGLSVAQISYFLNILIQIGIINHTNQREIFRTIANNFKTRVTDSISVDSLSSKFYNVEDSTKSTIREKIIQLLNLTNK
jgi:hypothetical protein